MQVGLKSIENVQTVLICMLHFMVLSIFMWKKSCCCFFALILRSWGCSLVGLLFTNGKQEKVGLWCIWYFCHSRQACLWCHWPLSSKWQHAWSCFCDFQTLVFNKPGTWIMWKTAVCICFFFFYCKGLLYFLGLVPLKLLPHACVESLELLLSQLWPCIMPLRLWALEIVLLCFDMFAKTYRWWITLSVFVCCVNVSEIVLK